MEKKSAEQKLNLAMARAAKTLQAQGLNESQIVAVVEIITDIAIRAIDVTREKMEFMAAKKAEEAARDA